jgi:hypothetical protein
MGGCRDPLTACDAPFPNDFSLKTTHPFIRPFTGMGA